MTASSQSARCGPGQRFRMLDVMRSGSPRQLSHGRTTTWDTTGVLLPESIARGRVDLAAVFGNDRPVEVEVGTGKGTFLLARAAGRPELNFLGIEWANAYCHYAADRFRRAGLENARMLRADAGSFLRTCLPDQSIWRLHVYFPDPWPKRRHHRRRLIQPSFVADAWRLLRPGGQLLIVTDHRDYFEHIRRVLDGARGLAHIGFPKLGGDDNTLVGTNFERKYIAQRRPFYWAARLRYAGRSRLFGRSGSLQTRPCAPAGLL